jgi:hypothetical protein
MLGYTAAHPPGSQTCADRDAMRTIMLAVPGMAR